MRLLSIATCGLLVFATPSPTQARATGGLLFVPEVVGPPVVIVDVKPLRVYHNGAWEGFVADEAVIARAADEASVAYSAASNNNGEERLYNMKVGPDAPTDPTTLWLDTTIV